MTFVFRDDYCFDWPVSVRLPGADEDCVFTGKFKLTEDATFFAPIEIAHRADAVEAEISRLAEVFVGWDGILTEDGQDLPVSDAARRKLLAHHPVRMAVLKAYNAAVYLGGEREKN